MDGSLESLGRVIPGRLSKSRISVNESEVSAYKNSDPRNLQDGRE